MLYYLLPHLRDSLKLQLLADMALGRRVVLLFVNLPGSFRDIRFLGQIVAVLIYEDGPLENLDWQSAVRHSSRSFLVASVDV